MIIRGDMNKLPFKKSMFDCIVSIQTIDPSNVNAKKFFRECNRIIRKDSFLLFNIPNNHSYKKYIHRILSKYRNYYRYSFDEIMVYLEEEGFEVKKCRGYNWIPFNRDSNNVLLGLFEFLENVLRLDHFPAISPTVFFVAKKKEEII